VKSQEQRAMDFRRAVRKLLKSPLDPVSVYEYTIASVMAMRQGYGVQDIEQIINEVYLGKSKLKILYVEDDKDVAKAMTRFFGMVDVEPTHFTSAQKAVNALESEEASFDLVLTDWNLIGAETGQRVVEAARAKGLPVRIYSGREWDSTIDASLKDIWLPKRGNKPVNDFIDEVRSVPLR